MTRHFLGLFLIIVATLAAVSWGQDKLLQLYSKPELPDESALKVAASLLRSELGSIPTEQWQARVAAEATKTGVGLELFRNSDIAGEATLDKLNGDGMVQMQSASGESWALRRLNADYVLAVESIAPALKRGPLEWALTLVFYVAIALGIMLWIWPLARDLRALESAAAQYGNRNWSFPAQIKPHSQIYGLATTFRNMATRIDSLIASHKDMSNAVSHEIKTPLSRMQFEIELAQQATELAALKTPLGNIKSDIAAINGLVSSTLSYAILERAGLELNLSRHDFTALIPGIAAQVERDSDAAVRIRTDVQSDASAVLCDAHLFESVLKNLLYNGVRYARRDILVTFRCDAGANRLLVDDDGPGIAPDKRTRVFEPFVQLDQPPQHRVGFGLGLAIVKRCLEWHGGQVEVSQGPLGGARFTATWPPTGPA